MTVYQTSVCIYERLPHTYGMSRRRMCLTPGECSHWAVTTSSNLNVVICFRNGWVRRKPSRRPPPVLHSHLVDGDNRHSIFQLLDGVQQARPLAGRAGGGADAGEAHGGGAEPAGEAELWAGGAGGRAQEADRPEGWRLQRPGGQAAGSGVAY